MAILRCFMQTHMLMAIFCFHILKYINNVKRKMHIKTTYLCVTSVNILSNEYRARPSSFTSIFVYAVNDNSRDKY